MYGPHRSNCMYHATRLKVKKVHITYMHVHSWQNSNWIIKTCQNKYFAKQTWLSRNTKLSIWSCKSLLQHQQDLLIVFVWLHERATRMISILALNALSFWERKGGCKRIIIQETVDVHTQIYSEYTTPKFTQLKRDK